MKQQRRWLVIKANGDCRVVQRWPSQLRGDECAVRLVINQPDGWGKILEGEVQITLPEPPFVEPGFTTITAADNESAVQS